MEANPKVRTSEKAPVNGNLSFDLRFTDNNGVTHGTFTGIESAAPAASRLDGFVTTVQGETYGIDTKIGDAIILLAKIGERSNLMTECSLLERTKPALEDKLWLLGNNFRRNQPGSEEALDQGNSERRELYAKIREFEIRLSALEKDLAPLRL